MNDRAVTLDVRVERRIHSRLRLDVAFTLGAECGIIFGRSGAGKTSLLRLIAGLDRPDAGFARLGPTPLFDAARRIDVPLRSRRVGMIFQDDLLFPHRDVAGNIGFGLSGWQRPEAARRLKEVAALCGVEHLLGRDPATLSGGERQRVGLARALAPRPRLLLCDEPVSALDLESRYSLIERLRSIPRSEGVPVVYVTHSPAEAIALGDRLFHLIEGRIGAEGRPLEVLAAAALGPETFEGLRNLLPAAVAGHAPERGETHLRLAEGPTLIVPHQDLPLGAAIAVLIRADDILISRGPAADLSARNRIAGRVVRIVPHGTDAEVVVRTGRIDWLASVVASAVTALELRAGAEVHLIMKARSCHVLHRAGAVS